MWGVQSVGEKKTDCDSSAASTVSTILDLPTFAISKHDMLDAKMWK